MDELFAIMLDKLDINSLDKWHNSVKSFLKSSKMTAEEAYSIFLYTSATFFKDLNFHLRSGTQNGYLLWYKKTLNSALEKLPAQKSKVLYRGVFNVENNDIRDIEAFVKSIQQAKNNELPYKFKEFVSVAKTKEASFWEYSKVRIRVFPAEGKKLTEGAKKIDQKLVGKPITEDSKFMGITIKEGHSEALYPSGSRFNITKVKEENGITFIDLEEILN